MQSSLRRRLLTRVSRPQNHKLILSSLPRQPKLQSQYQPSILKHNFTTTHPKMSFSNADTGAKEADPYKSKNIDTPTLKEKVEDLNEFIDACKFGMMTTRDGKTGALVSRCMAVAAKVHISLFFFSYSILQGMGWDICKIT